MLALLLALPLSQAATLKPTWSASSSAPTAEGVSYEPKNLGDGKASSAWFEGVDGSGLNEWVQADLGGEKAVTGFTVWAGWWYTSSQWSHYNRPKTLQVEFSDGASQEFTLQDAYVPQVFELAAPHKTTTLKFKVKSDFTSDAYQDTAISEIQIRDGSSPDFVAVRTFGASTIFPTDVDGSYEPKNLEDGILDTVWCEGNKAGDGTGEWLDFAFNGAKSVSRLMLRNGNAYNFGIYMKSNRGTAATLTFGDGTKESIVIKDSPAEQTITFPAHTTDHVRVTFDTVKKGSEYNDMCVAEAYFLP